MKKTLITSLILLTLTIGNSLFAQKLSIIPKMITYSFTSSESKLINGTSTERPKPTKINQDDQIAKAGVVSLYYQNNCYTDGRFNHNNFKVQHGKVSGGGKSFDAYKVHPPQHKAKKFLASNHVLYYKFSKKVAHNVYQLNGEKVTLIREIKASEVKSNAYTKIEEINLSQLEEPETYFFAPASEKMSAYKELSASTSAAFIKKTSIADVYKYQFDVPEIPHNSEDRYQDKSRKFFLMKPNSKTFGTVWQGIKKDKVYLSTVNSDFGLLKTRELPNALHGKLAAATTDEKGNIYYIIVKDFTQKTSKIILYKVNSSGKFIAKKEQDASKKEMNFFNYGNYGGIMRFVNGELLLMIARTMHKSSDGLNHQGGIAVSFDAKTLEKKRNWGQTSGHSFDNTLTIDSKGNFIGTDLGDNYPRGINLHKINQTSAKNRVVMTFKTLHGTRASYSSGMPSYPKYSEISKGGKQFYKWSNDNNTYTSLGGTHEVKGGYAVIFTSEPSPQGKLLDNSRAGENDDPRNIGFLKVVPNFETVSSSGNNVSSELILSKGISETGGFYSFGGSFSKQANHGIVWLTKLKAGSKQNVRHLKTAKLASGNLFLLWELEENRNYINTFSMIISPDGRIIKPQTEIGKNVRLIKRDELLVSDDKVYLACGNSSEKKLEIVVFKLK